MAVGQGLSLGEKSEVYFGGEPNFFPRATKPKAVAHDFGPILWAPPRLPLKFGRGFWPYLPMDGAVPLEKKRVCLEPRSGFSRIIQKLIKKSHFLAFFFE